MITLTKKVYKSIAADRNEWSAGLNNRETSLIVVVVSDAVAERLSLS